MSENRKTSRRRTGFFRGFFEGLSVYFRVVPVLFRHRLWPVQFLPAFLSLFISVAMFTGFWFIAEFVARGLDARTELAWEWLDQALITTIRFATFLLLAVAFLFIHKQVVLILLSPFLGKLAEATYRAVNRDESVSPLTTGQAISRSLRINLANVVKEMLINVFFLACNLVPGIGPVFSAAGLFFNQARFIGFGLMDFPLEHRGLNVGESLRFARARTGCSTGVGAGYVILMLFPLVGWMFAPTFGTVAGTLMTIREMEREGPGIPRNRGRLS